MTTALGPPRDEDLEGRANEAKRRLLSTLDVLAERRHVIRANLHRARERLESGAATLSMVFLVGVALLGLLTLTRLTLGPRRRRRR
jgi:hypothetical protein